MQMLMKLLLTLIHFLINLSIQSKIRKVDHVSTLNTATRNIRIAFDYLKSFNVED